MVGPLFASSYAVDEIHSIYDGDTFRVTIAALDPLVGERISVRIRGIDAAEMRSKDAAMRTQARQAKQHLVALLRQAKHVTLYNVSRGKYFRLIADVYADDTNVAEHLLEQGLVLPYRY